MIEFFVVIFGLVVGSFLNAVIYRLHAKASFIKGRSFCPHCKKPLAILDLIPVFSFLFLRGRCRNCKKKISWQYPIVETVCAIVFLLLYLKFSLTAAWLVYVLYACILVVIFVYDLLYYLILDKVTIPGLIVAIILSYFVLEISIVHILLGVLIGGGFFFLQFVFSKGKWIGGGDIRLGALMGAMLGYQYLLVALFIAYVLGSVIGLMLIYFGKKKWKSQVPFGTFLSMATLATFFIGGEVVYYYKGLFLL